MGFRFCPVSSFTSAMPGGGGPLPYRLSREWGCCLLPSYWYWLWAAKQHVEHLLCRGRQAPAWRCSLRRRHWILTAWWDLFPLLLP